MITMSPLRPKEDYGDVSLSVQASEFHYSDPRENDLPLSSYSHVEVAVMGPVREYVVPAIKFGEIDEPERTRETTMCRPSDIGIDGFDDMFEDGNCPVAGYMAQADLARLRQAMADRAAAL